MGPNQREKVVFEQNIPQTVTLRWPEGKMISTRFGESVMYGLADDRVMFLDLGVAQKINMLEPNAGESITICKRNSKVWDVWLSPATEKLRTARGQSMGARTLDPDPERPEPEQQDLVPVLQASVRAASERRYATLAVPRNGNGQGGPPQSIPQPPRASQAGDPQAGRPTDCPKNSTPPPIAQAFAQFLLERTEALIDVYAAAIRYANEKHGAGIVKNEDIRALLTTAYINQARGGNSNA